MRPDRWKEIERVFHEALAVPVAERADFLQRTCGPNEDLRRAVAGMLAAHESDPDFLNTPIGDVARMDQESGWEEAFGTGPSWIGSYEVVRRLGHGGMGEVFLARQETDAFSRSVAIKVVKRGMDTDASSWNAAFWPPWSIRTSPSSTTRARRWTGAHTS